MTDKEMNEHLMLSLKVIYELDLDLISESEFNKWMNFLQTDSVMQSSTMQDELIEWLKEFENRISKERHRLLSNRSELAAMLEDANIENNINSN